MLDRDSRSGLWPLSAQALLHCLCGCGALGGILPASASAGECLCAALWTWIATGNFGISFGLYSSRFTPDASCDHVRRDFSFTVLDQNTAHDKDYSRFFAYMNLFVASMLLLIFGSNLLVLYLGWEGVG